MDTELTGTPSGTTHHRATRRTRDETRRAVLDTAGRLFFAKGVERTTLRDIARETGLSAPGVILHFSSKADILATLILNEMHERMNQIPSDTEFGATPLERVVGYFEWMARHDVMLFKVFPAAWSLASHWSRDVEREIESTTDEMLAPVSRALSDAIRDANLHRLDIGVVTDLIWRTYLSGLRRACVLGGRPCDAVEGVRRVLRVLEA